MTTSAVTRLRQHQRVTPLAGALARMGAGDASAFVTTRAPFTGTLTMTAGAGSISHSRADTFAPTTTDHAGIVRTCKVGEVRFWGLRRIENLVTSSESFAAWSASKGGTGANPVAAVATDTPPSGVAQCWRVAFDKGSGSSSSDLSALSTTVASASGRALRFSVYARAAYSSDVGKDVAVRMSGGTAVVTTLTASWQRLQAIGTATGATEVADVLLRGGTTTANNITVLLAGAQVEDVTSQTDTTAGEYVSTGVASGPAYHGANVDGVRYYATAQDGSTITGGGLLIEGSTQNLLNSTDLTSVWSGPVSVSNDGTMAAGLAMCKIAKTTGSASEAKSIVMNGGAAASAGWYCTRVWLLASANSTQCSVGLLGGTSAWGLNANAKVTKISGPATVTQDNGALASATGLSTTVPTVVEIKRELLVSELLYLFVYPDTYNSTTSGRANYVAVGNVEAGSMCTSRIPTSGTMLTRAADVPTLPTAGNLCAEWGAVSATVTLPSVSAYNSSRVVLNLDGQSAYPMVMYDTPGGCATQMSMWGTSASKAATAYTPGTPVKVASAWRGGDLLAISNAGASAARSASAATAVALPTNLRLGSGPSAGSYPLQGVIRDLCFYGLDLTPTQLQTVTT